MNEWKFRSELLEEECEKKTFDMLIFFLSDKGFRKNWTFLPHEKVHITFWIHIKITWDDSNKQVNDGNYQGESSLKTVSLLLIQLCNFDEPIKSNKIDNGNHNLNDHNQWLDISIKTQLRFFFTQSNMT